MQNCAVVVTFTLASIAERHKVALVLLKCLKSLDRARSQHDDHEGSHKEGCISQFVWLVRTVVENSEVFVLIVL
jgi:hypothetical protein